MKITEKADRALSLFPIYYALFVSSLVFGSIPALFAEDHRQPSMMWMTYTFYSIACFIGLFVMMLFAMSSIRGRDFGDGPGGGH